jgi:transcriptional regulator with XRE-family HTH domain
MSNHRFDAEAFYAALDSERESRGLTWKQVAKEARVSASTLTRMGQGKRPDVDSLASLATWAHIDIDQFLIAKKDIKASPAPLTQITALLRADRNLKTGGAEALEAILKSAYVHLRKVKRDET